MEVNSDLLCVFTGAHHQDTKAQRRYFSPLGYVMGIWLVALLAFVVRFLQEVTPFGWRQNSTSRYGKPFLAAYSGITQNSG